MGISVGGGKSGAIAEMNVVPLIDILLVLLIIFMVISPHVPVGLAVTVPEPAPRRAPPEPAGLVVLQVLSDGSLRLNQEPVIWQNLQGGLEEIFKARASRIAFVRGDGSLEFSVIARAIDAMRGSGITSVGLMTPELEKTH